MLNILSEFLIKRKEVLEEGLLRCIRFSGSITLKKKPHGKLKANSIKTFPVFLNLPKVHKLPALSLFI